jgi:F-box-like
MTKRSAKKQRNPVRSNPPLESSSTAMFTGARDSSLLRLPNELLDDIILRLMPQYSSNYLNFGDKSSAHKMGATLMTVCRQFRAVVTPRLYHSLSFMFFSRMSASHRGSRASLLHRSLEENAELRGHCRELSISIKPFVDIRVSPSKKDIHILQDFMSWMINLRVLNVYHEAELVYVYQGQYDTSHLKAAPKIFEALREHQAVEVLSYTLMSRNFQDMIFMNAHWPNLKRLEIYISRVCAYTTTYTWADRYDSIHGFSNAKSLLTKVRNTSELIVMSPCNIKLLTFIPLGHGRYRLVHVPENRVRKRQELGRR